MLERDLAQRSAVVRTAAAGPRKFGIHLLSVPSGVNRSISEQLYGSPWVPNLGKCVPFHGDKEEEGSAGFKGDANGI